jgi:hypothetical protein
MRVDPILLSMVPYLLLVLAALASLFRLRRTAVVIALLVGWVLVFKFFHSAAIEAPPPSVVEGPFLVWTTGVVLIASVIVGTYLVYMELRK